MSSRKRPVDENHPVVRAIRWIIDNCRQPDGKLWNMRALSKAAGLNPVHVGQILSGEQSADITTKTATKIADAAGVNLTWFMTGEGEPIQQGQPVVRQKTSKERAIDAARALGTVSEEAIARVLTLSSKGAYSPDDWLVEIQAEERRVRNSIAPTPSPYHDDSDPDRRLPINTWPLPKR